MTHKKALKRTHTCLKCGGTWQSIVELPSRCARCGVRTWTERKPQEIEEQKGLYVLPERMPLGEPCWLWYKKGNASGGHSKVGEYVGVSRHADKAPKRVKISLSHNKGWD
jgi:predicted  nucleic acid-binding Zn-ribbon protein